MDDARFAIEAALRGAFRFRGVDLVLHVPQRVEHLHNGNAYPSLDLPCVAQPFSHQPREPVMAVNEVVFSRFFFRKIEHPFYKFVQMGQNIGGSDGHFWPRLDVDDPRPKPQIMPHLWFAHIFRAGEYIHLNAKAAEFGRQITYIDIHTTCFFAAEHGQRTGVDTQHSDTPDRRGGQKGHGESYRGGDWVTEKRT